MRSFLRALSHLALAASATMRLDHARRAVVRNLLSAAALTVAPSLPASADAPPTYSLKGLAGALTGADAPRPADQLGVIGRGQNRDKSGRLNSCPADKKGCISTFSQFDEESYVPPWTYQPGFSTQATSPNDARRAALRAEVGAAAVEAGETKPAPKSREVAERELRTAIEAAPRNVPRGRVACHPTPWRGRAPVPHTVHTPQ